VRSGFVVLGYDPIGQGERRQYWNPETGRVDVGGPTTEHSMAGQLLLLVGEDLTHYRIWDGMRAIDYLQTRPEVDGSRIGCAGHSGGGTLTMFISALDERVKAAVINEGGTGHRWPMELRPEARIGPSDVEQNLFPAAMLGVDLCDIHTAIAPRPLLALIEDYNPRFNLAAEHLKNRYTQLGVAEKFATAEASDPHAWTPKLRIATTNFFRKWFLDAVPLESEAEFTPEEERKLYATPNGSILHSGTGETIYTLLRKKPLPSKACSAEDVARVLGYKRPAGGPESREIVRTPRQRYTIEKVEILSEPGIYLPVWVFWPAWHFREAPRAVVYVHEAGKEADGMEYGRLEKMAQQGQVVVAVDVRGIGATRPPHAAPGERPDEFGHLFNVETAMSYMAWYLDRSLFTMRVEDVVRTVDYATSRFDRAGVTMIGRGMGALWALYAAALDDRVKAVRCERMLKSYRTLIESDRYLHGANVFLRDVLLHFDIPQVAALVGGRLTVEEPVDAMKRYNA
jgi:cephalosporin-C deacetylase-like acetyl esterase